MKLNIFHGFLLNYNWHKPIFHFFSQENYHQHQWIWNIDQWRPWRQRAFQRMICSYNFFEQRQKILLRQLHRPKNIVRILYLHYMYLLTSFDYCVVSTAVVTQSFLYLYWVRCISFSSSKVSDISWVNLFCTFLL